MDYSPLAKGVLYAVSLAALCLGLYIINYARNTNISGSNLPWKMDYTSKNFMITAGWLLGLSAIVGIAAYFA